MNEPDFYTLKDKLYQAGIGVLVLDKYIRSSQAGIT